MLHQVTGYQRGITEVKTIQARKSCSVPETVYRYNTLPRGDDAASSPANMMFCYEVRLLGIDEVSQQDQASEEHHRFSVGDRVWIRHPSRRCNSRSLEGTVTRIVSAQNVEVDGVPCHVRDLRLATAKLCTDKYLSTEETTAEDNEEEMLISVDNSTASVGEEDQEEEEEDGSPERPLP